MKQRAAMKRDSIVPRFALSSLTTGQFRWLLPEGWNEGQNRAFLALRQSAGGGIFRAPPVAGTASAKRHAPPQFVGKWILEFTNEEPLLAVEAHAFFRNFKILSVVVGGRETGLDKREEDALSLMISGLIIMTKADVVQVVATNNKKSQALVAAGFGPARPVFSPAADLFGLDRQPVPVFQAITTVSIEAFEWWQSERGARDRQTLAYLEKRVDLGEKMAAPKKKRENLFARLTSFLHW